MSEARGEQIFPGKKKILFLMTNSIIQTLETLGLYDISTLSSVLARVQESEQCHKFGNAIQEFDTCPQPLTSNCSYGNLYTGNYQKYRQRLTFRNI